MLRFRLLVQRVAAWSGSQLQPPRLEGNLPILAGEWTIWLPNEFAVVGADANDGRLNWRQRLFGPLGRPIDNQPFDPRRGNSWSRLLTGWADEGPAAGSTRKDLRCASSRNARAKVVRHYWTGTRPQQVQSQPLSRAGWRAYRRMFVAGLPEPIAIAHPSATAAWAVAIFLLCLAGGDFATSP